MDRIGRKIGNGEGVMGGRRVLSAMFIQGKSGTTREITKMYKWRQGEDDEER